MGTIYDRVFGITMGQAQVHCCFHNDTKASAGISPTGQYNCFTCGAKAASESGFISKYFDIGNIRADRIKNILESCEKYQPSHNPITKEQRDYLHNIGIVDNIIDKYFTCSNAGKLYSIHTWNGLYLSSTWFNSPILSNYNAGEPKYKYNGVIGGMCVPYDDVQIYSSLLICEGEKDMYTAKSIGIPNAVAKLGGCATPLIAGINFQNKTVVICYDCDDAGRKGAIIDATNLTNKYNCKVKVIDLGLQDKEDLNDYFVKYGHTKQDFYNLIKSTPLYVQPSIDLNNSRVKRFYESLTDIEKEELKNIIKEEIK